MTLVFTTIHANFGGFSKLVVIIIIGEIIYNLPNNLIL